MSSTESRPDKISVRSEFKPRRDSVEGTGDHLNEAPQAVYGISPLEHPELRDLIEMRDMLNREIARAMMLPACLLEVPQRDGQPAQNPSR